MKFEKKDLKIVIIIIASAFLYALNFKTFIEKGNLFPGGFAGLSRLLSKVIELGCSVTIEYSIIYFGLNVIVTFLVFKYIGKKFALYSILHYTLASILIKFLPGLDITNDIFLVCVFGGVVNGLSILMALENNASSGGTDFIAIYTSAKYNVSTWNYIFVFNAIVLTFAGLIYGWNTALYSIVFQYCSTTIIGQLHDRFKLIQLQIVTDKGDEMANVLLKLTAHGVTSTKGIGAYSHLEKEILYTTVSLFQLNYILKEIKKIDQKSFVSVIKVEKILGRYHQEPFN